MSPEKLAERKSVGLSSTKNLFALLVHMGCLKVSDNYTVSLAFLALHKHAKSIPQFLPLRRCRKVLGQLYHQTFSSSVLKKKQKNEKKKPT